MTLNELRKLLDAAAQERAAIYAAAEARFADPEDKTEVRGAYVLDGDGKPTNERDEHAGLTAGEVARLAELNDDEALLRTRVERAEVLERAAAAGQTARPYADVQFAPVTSTEAPHDFERAKKTAGAELRGMVSKALEQSMASDEARTAIEATIEKVRKDRPSGVVGVQRYAIATSSDEYRTAFSKVLSNREFMLTDAERQAVAWADEARAAITIATGLSFPIDIDPSFIHTGTRAVNAFRRLATVRTGTENTHKVNVFGSATMAMAADGAEVAADGTPADSSVSIAAQTMQGILQYTIASAADLDGLVSELGVSAADAIDVLESAQFTNGTGDAPQVEGLLDGTTITRVTTAVADTFKEVDLHSTYAALGVRYRPNAVWMTSSPGHLDLTRLENTAGFRIGLAQRPGMAADGQLLNQPWFENSELPGPTTPAVWVTDNVVAIYGDIAQAYRIYDVLGTTVEVIPHMFGTANNLPNGTRGLYIRKRLGAGITNAAAAKCVKIA